MRIGFDLASAIAVAPSPIIVADVVAATVRSA
jgi:hypothetical protein